jgi:L-ribulokinase
MQTYADITGRPIMVSRSAQTCALGAAMAGAVCGGAHPSFAAAARAMTGVKRRVFKPDARSRRTYRKLFGLYMDLHDAFGSSLWKGRLHHVMKELLDLRDRVRSA